MPNRHRASAAGRTRRVLASGVALAAVSVLAAGPSAVADSRFNVIADNVPSPKGIALAPGNRVAVTQWTFEPDPSAHATVFRLDDSDHVKQRYALDTNGPAADIARITHGWWILGNDGKLYRKLGGHDPVLVKDIVAYQQSDPDPTKPGEDPESNPFGLAALPNGDAVVADAAGNDIIRVTPGGRAWTVARLDKQIVRAPEGRGVPVGTPIPADPVPTSVAVGPDGALYVGELKGFPFRPGSSNVWRVPADARGAWCSVQGSRGGCSRYLRNLTAIADMAWGGKGGRTLFVYEYSKEHVAFLEEEPPTGPPPPAVLLAIRNGERHELARGKLFLPGGVVATHDELFVTDGIFGQGRLVQIELERN